jgi:AbrB family looped-hinge helix DNA binding protein
VEGVVETVKAGKRCTIVIPRMVRRKLGIREGDVLTISVEVIR